MGEKNETRMGPPSCHMGPIVLCLVDGQIVTCGGGIACLFVQRMRNVIFETPFFFHR